MSSDDRERMMKSRALPEDFPMIQTLHAPYGARIGSLGTPMQSPVDYSSPTSAVGGTFRFFDNKSQDMRNMNPRTEYGAVSPVSGPGGMNGFQAMAYTPPASDMMSPTSSSGDRPYMNYMPGSMKSQPRSVSNPFGRNDQPGNYRSHPHVRPLQLHEGVPRSISDSISTPLKSSGSYGSSVDYNDYQIQSAHSVNGMQFIEPPRSVPPSADPFSSAYSSHYSHAYPSPVSVQNPSHRSSSATFPPPLGLSSNGYAKHGEGPMTPHTGGMAGFQSAPLNAPSDYHMPQLSAPADSGFSGTYLSNTGGRPGTSGGASPGQLTPQSSTGREDYQGHQRRRSSSHPPNFASAS
jgi:hypothetical protein